MSEEKAEITISKEDLNAIKSAKEKLQFIDTQRKIAELDLDNVVLRVYIKNKLEETDVIDEATGKIIKNSLGE